MNYSYWKYTFNLSVFGIPPLIKIYKRDNDTKTETVIYSSDLTREDNLIFHEYNWDSDTIEEERMRNKCTKIIEISEGDVFLELI